MNAGKVTLGGEQVSLCSAIVAAELRCVCRRINRNVTANGRPLSKKARHKLVCFSMQVQLLLLALGMSSATIARLVRDSCRS
jgi:hypothetical protein